MRAPDGRRRVPAGRGVHARTPAGSARRRGRRRRATPTPFHLRAGGAPLDRRHRRPTSSRTRYGYDPADPVAETVGGNCWALCAALGDRRRFERAAATSLTYTDAPARRRPRADRAGDRGAVRGDQRGRHRLHGRAVSTSSRTARRTRSRTASSAPGTATAWTRPSLVEPGEVVRVRDRPVRDQLPRAPRATGCGSTSRRAASTATTATRTRATPYGHAADPVVAAPGDPPLAGAARRTSCCRSLQPAPDALADRENVPHVATFPLGPSPCARGAGPVRSPCTERGAAFSRRPGYSERPSRGPGAVREAPAKRRPPARCLVVRPLRGGRLERRCRRPRRVAAAPGRPPRADPHRGLTPNGDSGSDPQVSRTEGARIARYVRGCAVPADRPKTNLDFRRA